MNIQKQQTWDTSNKLHAENVADAENSLKRAFEIGKFLTAEKAKVKHGEWLKLHAENAEFPIRTATAYMKCFACREELQAAKITQLNDAYEFLSNKPVEITHSNRQALADLKQDSGKPLEKNQGDESRTNQPVPTPVKKTELAKDVEIIPPKRKQKPDKATGFLIPSKIQPLWDRAAGEAEGLLQIIKQLRSVTKSAQDDDDVIYSEVKAQFSELRCNLDNAKAMLERVAPYAVCIVCQGQNAEQCPYCNGRGFHSELLWEMSDATLRKIRAQQK